jgi:hypothetical protein
MLSGHASQTVARVRTSVESDFTMKHAGLQHAKRRTGTRQTSTCTSRTKPAQARVHGEGCTVARRTQVCALLELNKY